MNFYTSYTGSKRKDFKEYSDLLFDIIEKNNIKTIVEPFGGSGIQSAYIFDKFGNKLNYHINDIDSRLIDFLIDMKNKNYDKYNDELKKYLYIADIEDKVEKCKEIRKIGNNILKNNNNSINYFIKQKVFPVSNRLSSHLKISLCNFEDKRFTKYNNFITSDNVIITNDDFLNIIEKYKNDETALLIYDPPYFMSDNSDYSVYHSKHKDEKKTLIDNTKIFVDIINNFNNDKNISFYVINKTALMDYLMSKYYVSSYNKLYSITQNRTIHNIYCNSKKS